MATWKKVIVSGSQAEFAGASGSFSGSFFGNGAGLTGVTATAIFPTTAKTDLASTDQFYINDGANKYITYANLLTDLAGTNLAVEGSDSLTLASQIAVTGVTASFTGSLTGTASFATTAGNAINLNGQAASFYLNASNINAGTIGNAYLPSAINVTSVSASFTGSLTGALIGNATTATSATTATNATNTAVTDTTTGTGPYYITFTAASTGNTPQLVDSTGLTYNATTNTITATSSYASQALSSSFASTAPYSGLSGTPAGIISASASGDAQGQIKLNGVNVNVTTLQQASSPTFADLSLTGDITVGGQDIKSNGGTTVFTLSGANATVAGDLTVSSNLYVNGTTSVINTTNLFVEDQFILLASGSTVATDGGIVIDRGADAGGNFAFGYDSAKDRWGFQTGLADTTNTFDPTSGTGASGSFVPYLFTETDHGATKPIVGEFAQQGAMYITTAGDFWIYA